jgi:hypothetical protein
MHAVVMYLFSLPEEKEKEFITVRIEHSKLIASEFTVRRNVFFIDHRHSASPCYLLAIISESGLFFFF